MTIEFDTYQKKMEKSLDILKRDFQGLRTGRASSALL